ncbi:MAG: ATP-binding protein [Actinomycetota bacterium]
MSLRSRLVLAAGYLLSVAVIALAVPLALNVQRRIAAEFEANLRSRAALVASQIADDVARVGEQPIDEPESREERVRLATIVRRFAEDAPSERILVVERDGVVVADSSGSGAIGSRYATSDRPELAAALEQGAIDVRRRSSETLGATLLLVTVPVLDDAEVVGAVRVSGPVAAVDDRVSRGWLAIGLVGIAVIGAGLGVAWLLATSLARPVRRLESAAAGLGAGDLDRRAVPEGPSEVRSLAESFNRMAASVEELVTSQREFTADASHQLRTPLTGLRLRLEALERVPGAEADVAKAQREVDRLQRLVEDLLRLARSSEPGGTPENVDLRACVVAAIERWRDAADRADVALVSHTDGRPARIDADPGDLAQVLDNLVSNAVRSTPPGGRVTLTTGHRDDRALLAVIDTGPGIPEAERGKIFERFARGASGHAAGEGSGLGLPIARDLVRRWGGELGLARPVPGTGAVFEAVFQERTES